MAVSSMNKTLALEVEGVSYAYGNKLALSEVRFRVPEGSCTILLGPNGAGKSTLFSLITHLYDSPTGQIRIGGHDIRQKPLLALGQLGVVFQQNTLDLDLTVRQNLLYHAALHGLSAKVAEKRLEEELERQGMLERAHEKARELNGGHRRRVEIARALLHQPRLLLLDEPTVGLDVPSRKALVDHIHSLSHSGQLAVLWATHLIDEIGDQDELVVLHQGTVRRTGTVASVLSATESLTISDAFDQLTRKGAPAP